MKALSIIFKSRDVTAIYTLKTSQRDCNLTLKRLFILKQGSLRVGLSSPSGPLRPYVVLADTYTARSMVTLSASVKCARRGGPGMVSLCAKVLCTIQFNAFVKKQQFVLGGKKAWLKQLALLLLPCRRVSLFCSFLLCV